jgi:hypothetical protein
MEDDEPPTESQYVTINTDGTNTRVRGVKKTVARRKLNVVAEDSEATHDAEGGALSVNRYLDFPSRMIEDEENHHPFHKICNSNVDPTLASVITSSQLCNNSGGGSGEVVKSSSSQTATVTSPPHHHQHQDKVVWKAQANEWTSRTQAFFDELDQRPLHEVQPGATTTSR